MSAVEKYESKFITSKDYKSSGKDLHEKFYEYYDRYIPDGIILDRADSDCDKIIAYCISKDAKIHEIMTVFVLYFKNIPVDEMVNWMKTHGRQELVAYKSYYNARKYAKIFKRG